MYFSVEWANRDALNIYIFGFDQKNRTRLRDSAASPPQAEDLGLKAQDFGYFFKSFPSEPIKTCFYRIFYAFITSCSRR